ncbi:MAG: response regulator transcription factor [Selenomonadaceae bacterium]|nr:response regulator transcription factor [Selenomonadaceae bacterium]
MRVFVLEDDENIGRLLETELKHEGFEVSREKDGRRGMERIIEEAPDIALLDIMLPSMNGVEVCRRVRKVSDLPIIMLTAKDEVSDKVTGLDTGADDYVTKPFVLEELLARIRAALRKRGAAAEEEKITLRNLTVYPARFEATVKGESVTLTKKEFMLLEYLLKNRKMVLNREQILEKVWGYDFMGDTNVVDVYVRYLRSKIDDAFGEKYIHTVRGVGYVIK